MEIWKALQNVENGVVWGYPSLSAMSPYDFLFALIETIRLSCTVYEIMPSIGPPPLYFDTPLIFNVPTEQFPWDDLRKG